MTTKSPKELETRAKSVKQMKEWICKQQHLPQNLDEEFIVRFLHSCYYELENTKKAMELFFTMRKSFSEVMMNRDPLSPEVQRAMQIFNLARLHVNGKNIWLWQINNLEQYEQLLDIKLFVLNVDSWILQDKTLEEKDIMIFDVKDISLKIMTKVRLSLSRKFAKYVQEAIPLRLMENHIVNVPPSFDKIFSFFKPFFKKELMKRIFLHTPNSQTLFDHISKEELPREFGGTLGSMQDHMKDVVHLITSRRDELVKENLWTAKDKKHIKTEDQDHEINDIRNLVLD